MYGFARKQKAEILSDYANRLITGVNSTDETAPIINPPQLANDLRFRRYFTPAQVMEPISAAHWDDDIGLWRAGVGLVRVYQRYNPLKDQDVTEDPATRMGPWNYDHNDGTEVKTSWREVLCYNIDPCTSHPIQDGEGHPNIVYTSEDIHGDLWVLERPTDTGPSFAMASSSECIVPGSGGLVELYFLDNGVWLPSGTYCDMTDPGCNIMALPGEKFWVSLDHDSCTGQVTGCHAPYPHGLVRRARIFQQIDCGEADFVTILASSGECGGTPTICKVKACNDSNRKLKCDGSYELEYEDCTIFLIQDKCLWTIIPDRRATKARATLAYPLCGTEAMIEDGSTTFIDVCDWNEKIDVAQNPFGHKACDQSQVELTWNEHTCEWYVSDVTRIEDRIVSRFTPCNSACDPLKESHYSKSAIETCECAAVSEDILRFTEMTLVTGLTFKLVDDGQGGQACVLEGQTATLCVAKCGDPEISTDTIQFTKKTVLDGLSLGSDGIHCHTINVFTPCDDGAHGDSLCIPTTDCVEEKVIDKQELNAELLLQEALKLIPRDRLEVLIRNALS